MYRILRIVVFCLLCVQVSVLNAQLGIGTEIPHESAELHVSSNKRGVLIPRMTTAQMNAISSKLESLLVYNTDDNIFYYYTGSAWEQAWFVNYSSMQDDDGDTRIEVEKNADEDIIRFSANADGNLVADGLADEVAIFSAKGFSLSNSNETYQKTGTTVMRQKNTSQAFGKNAGTAAWAGENVALGENAGAAIAGGSGNVLIGTGSGMSLTDGSNNVGVGAAALKSATVASGNLAVGAYAGTMVNADGNTLLGFRSGENVASGTDNLIIGSNAGQSIQVGSGNILIGNGIDLGADYSNRLNIGDLIEADFSAKQVTFNQAYTFPSDGGVSNSDLTFVTDGAGTLRWDSLNSSGTVSRTGIEGAAADIKSFNRILDQTVGGEDMKNFTWLVETVALVDAELTNITTFIKQTTGFSFWPVNYELHLGIFDENQILLGYGIKNLTFGPDNVGYVTVTNLVDPSGNPLPNGVHVEIGKKYYLGAHSTCNSINSSVDIFIVQYQDNDAKSPRTGESGFVNFGPSYSISNQDKIIWIRAY